MGISAVPPRRVLERDGLPGPPGQMRLWRRPLSQLQQLREHPHCHLPSLFLSPLGADRRQPHLTLTPASRARGWVWDRPHPMKAGDGEAGPGDPPDFLGFSPSQLRIHPEEPEVPEEEVSPPTPTHPRSQVSAGIEI